MADYWKYSYNGHSIEIRNQTNMARLLIDGTECDQQKGLISAELHAKLDGGEEIKALLKAGLIAKCSLYIDDVLQKPIDS